MRLSAHLFCTFIVLLSAKFSEAQTTSAYIPAGVAIAPNSGSGFEQYNPFSGYMNATLPLQHVGGRGEAAVDLVWNLQPSWMAVQTVPFQVAIKLGPYPDNNGYSPSGAVSGAASAYGLSGPGFVYIRTGITWTSCTLAPPAPPTVIPLVATTLSSVIYVAPNGTQTTLISTTNGTPYNVAPPAQCGGSQGSSWNAGRGTSFESVDGSQLQFQASSSIIDYGPGTAGYGVSLVSGTLTFANGLKYTVSGSVVTQVEDRNGNYITLNYNQSAGTKAIDWSLSVPVLTSVVDSLGNTTNIGYNANSVTITDPAQHVTTVNTGNLYPSGHTSSPFGNNVYYAPTVANSVTLPDNSQYQFSYNSYGELSQVILPTGGAIQYDYAAGSGSNGGYLTGNNNTVMIYRRLTARREYANGVSNGITSQTTHTITASGGNMVDTVALKDTPGNNNNVLSQTVHTMSGEPTDSLGITGTSCNAPAEGQETETDYGSASGALMKVAIAYSPLGNCTFDPPSMTNPNLSQPDKINGRRRWATEGGTDITETKRMDAKNAA